MGRVTSRDIRGAATQAVPFSLLCYNSQMAERYKLIPEVFLILMKEGQVLLSRRFNTGWEDGKYGLPAGHGEDRETMREGIVREAKEEIGIDIKVEDLEFFLVQHRWSNDHARVGFYFVPKAWEGDIKNMEADKCDDLKFFPLDALPENTVPHVRAAINSFINGESYAEYGWEARYN